MLWAGERIITEGRARDAGWIPLAMNLHDAAWVKGRAHQGEFHLPLESWRTLLFPDWWGRPTGIQLPGAPANFNEGTIYPGAVALVLAAVGVAGTSWRRTFPWIVLAVIGLTAALGLPPAFQVLAHVPPFDM